MLHQSIHRPPAETQECRMFLESRGISMRKIGHCEVSDAPTGEREKSAD